MAKTVDRQLKNKMAELYDWLDKQIATNIDSSSCVACGDCCDFEKFGHRIYVTSLEAAYLKDNLMEEKLKAPVKGGCPYKVDNKCSMRDFRFGPCRIFFCKADSEFQNQLSEDFLKQIKQLCQQFNFEYTYSNLPDAISCSY